MEGLSAFCWLGVEEIVEFIFDKKFQGTVAVAWTLKRGRWL